MSNAIGMEDGINILTAAEAEKHFVTNLAVGAGYNRAGMQVLLEMAASIKSSSTSHVDGAEVAILQCPVCLDDGDSVVRPVFLPCMHALCRACALSLLKDKKLAEGSRNEILFCPFSCNSEGIGGAGLRRGYNRASLIEVVRTTASSKSSSSISSSSGAGGVHDGIDAPMDLSNGGGCEDTCYPQGKVYEGESVLHLAPTKCHASWASLETIPHPVNEVLADTIRPSAEYPCLPPVMLAHARTSAAGDEGPSGTKLQWMKRLIRQLLQEDITNKILILVENNNIVEGISAALEHDMLNLAMTSSSSSSAAITASDHGMLDDDNTAWSEKSFVRVDTTGSAAYRAKQINLFTDDPAVAVCVATRSIAGVGLNLTVANVVLLFDPAPSLGEESQAVNRVLRLGQTRSVRIYRVYMKHSVEERLLSWRKQQGELDSDVMGSSSFSVSESTDGGDEESGSGKRGKNKNTEMAPADGAQPVLKQWRVLLGSV